MTLGDSRPPAVPAPVEELPPAYTDRAAWDTATKLRAWQAAALGWSPDPHGRTHPALRKECGGPAAAVATVAELASRISRIRDWAASRRSG